MGFSAHSRSFRSVSRCGLSSLSALRVRLGASPERGRLLPRPEPPIRTREVPARVWVLGRNAGARRRDRYVITHFSDRRRLACRKGTGRLPQPARQAKPARQFCVCAALWVSLGERLTINRANHQSNERSEAVKRAQKGAGTTVAFPPNLLG